MLKRKIIVGGLTDNWKYRIELVKINRTRGIAMCMRRYDGRDNPARELAKLRPEQQDPIHGICQDMEVLLKSL